ncbi:hypothetical protein ACFQ1S_21990 [Kibdelosporangium lantanae]|uniref:Uncharacterized protein n=1 Tax=Kibdelosporangium lantanae TaxID=1497396 RepID=A0ABW3MBV4_9PSEU
MVLIGRDINTADVHSRLTACVADTEVDPGDMLWVTRYVSEHPS